MNSQNVSALFYSIFDEINATVLLPHTKHTQFLYFVRRNIEM